MNESTIAKEVKIEHRISIKLLGYLFIKRLFDICVALIGILFLIPITIIVKTITMCSGDFHSIFYTQERIGKGGRTFKIFKFRSMVPNADEILEKILKDNKELATKYRKMKKLDNDPRITRVGNFLRKSSLDELPQMLNILRNEMTLIGNRPYLPREKDDMGKYYENIVLTKPGLTGFWQVSLRSRGTFEQRLKMEEYYSKNCSLRFDLNIFFKTFKVVLKRDGAK